MLAGKARCRGVNLGALAVPNRKATTVDAGLVGSLVVVLALVWIPLFAWTLSVVLTTPAQVWRAAGTSQLLWLVVVLGVPLVGAVLFAAVWRSRLQVPGDGSVAR